MSLRVLNIAEKPSVAKGICDILARGGAKKRTSPSQFNPIFEFPFTLRSRECTMVLSSVTGHLMEYDVHPRYKSWQSCDPMEMFSCPVVRSIPPDKKRLETMLTNEARSCQWLVLWLDCDREGESIAYEVVDVCRAVKPHIEIFRAHFSAITPAEIHRACNTLTPPNKLLADAVDARSEIDLRIGAAFTRWQTLRLRHTFPTLNSSLISYGSCQFPTLGFVVDRFLAAKNFEPEEFWIISVRHQFSPSTTCSSTTPFSISSSAIDANAMVSSSSSSKRKTRFSNNNNNNHASKKNTAKDQVTFTWHRGRLFNQLACTVLFERCREKPLATVVDIQQKETKKWKPYPLTTVVLQKLASRKLRLSAHKTMEIAERLYTQGYISYPRTETDQFPESLNLHGLIQVQLNDPRWSGFAQQLLSGAFGAPKKGKHNDHSHPPIHPTKVGSSLSGDEQRVYELVTRHFLACCSLDALGYQTTVEIEINQELFTTKGLIVLQRNYLDVYVYDKWVDSELPAFELQQTFVPSRIEITQGRTQAPPLLSEADLIALMDQNGIGTDATIAQHIDTILKREYAFKENDRFVPSTLGVALVQAYSQMAFQLKDQLSKPYLRAKMEADMNAITQGTQTKEAVLLANISMYSKIFQTVSYNYSAVREIIAQYIN